MEKDAWLQGKTLTIHTHPNDHPFIFNLKQIKSLLKIS